MIYSIITLLNYIEEAIANMIILSSLERINTRQKRELFKRILMYISAYSISGFFCEMIIDSPIFLKLMHILIGLIVIALTYKSDISLTLVLYSLNYIIVYAIQEPLAFAVSFFVRDVSDYRLGLLCNLLTIIIALGIKAMVPIKKFYNLVLEQNRSNRVILINLFLLFQLIDFYYKTKETLYQMNIFYIFICVLIIAILNFLILYEENEVNKIKDELAIVKSNSNLMDNMIKEIRRTQHQYDDRINAIISLASVCEDYESLKTEMLQQAETLTKEPANYNILKINLKLIAALLFTKANQAASNGINFDIKIKKNHLTSNANEKDLLDIFSILINNMLEATPKNSHCFMIIDSSNGKTKIITSNEGPKLDEELQSLLFTDGYTTKKNQDAKHGHGLYTLRKLVLKNAGSFGVVNEYSADRLKTYIVFTVEV